jgi:cytidylate kinase
MRPPGGKARALLRARAAWHHRARMAAAGPTLVTIDGPAGAGKSTVARALARALGLPLLDTGAIYRTLALVARQRGVAWDDERGLAELAADFPIEFGALPVDPAAPQPVRFDGADVTAAIRTPEIAQGASKVSALPAVRAALLGIQRAIGARGAVAEGRDMGTVVFPDAPHKFFVTADLAVRAERRRAELPGGADMPIAQVVAELQERDLRDSTRAAAPLRRAEDAILVDTSALAVGEVVAAILAHLPPAAAAD